MQLDTETAAAILKSSAQCNAVAEEATRRVVELMQEGIEYRERISELEAAIEKALRHSDANGMKDWPVFRHLRKTLGR